MNELNVTNNKEKKRFEASVNDQIAYLEYIPAGKNMVLSHTEVPERLEGQGIGGRLVGQVLETVNSGDQKIIIVCPFVAAYIKKHPEYLDLIFGYRSR